MKLILRGLCLLFLASPVAGQALDDAAAESDRRAAEIEAMGPSVGSEALEASADDSEGAAPTAVIAADVKRNETGNQVMDELELGRTEITGNQELPTVMYIVPWQKSDPGELLGKPVYSLLDEILAPIDRSEFMRQIDYYDDLHTKDD
jgi:hypothetical protein